MYDLQGCWGVCLPYYRSDLTFYHSLPYLLSSLMLLGTSKHMPATASSTQMSFQKQPQANRTIFFLPLPRCISVTISTAHLPQPSGLGIQVACDFASCL